VKYVITLDAATATGRRPPPGGRHDAPAQPRALRRAAAACD
jgi:hypothetical protein